MSEADPDAVRALVLAAWAEALAPDEHAGTVPTGDPFSAAGGHSLAAARLVAALRRLLGVTVPLVAVLQDDPTPADLVALVNRLGPRLAGPDRAGRPTDPTPADRARPTRAALPGTLQSVWTFHRVHPESPAYNVVRVLTVPGRLRPTALRAALGDLVARHEALRSCVVESRPGHPELVVWPTTSPSLATVLVTDSGPLPAGPDWERWAPEPVRRALRAMADRVIDMRQAPLWRAALIYAPAADRSWVLLSMHHLISDLRASDVLMRDLASAYAARLEGRRLDAPSAPSLVDQLRAELRHATDADRDRDRAWWTQTLAGQPAARPLPLSLLPVGDDFAADTETLELPADGVDALVRRLRQTTATVFLTAAAAVLSAWCGEWGAELIGVPTARVVRPEDHDLVGFLLDTVPLRCPVSRTDGFAAACVAVRRSTVDALRHGAATFADILEDVRVARATARSPLIRLWFNDLSHARPPRTLAGAACLEYDLPPAWALFDLGVYVRRTGAGLRVHLVSPRGTMAVGDRRALLEQLCRLITGAARDPHRPLRDLLAARPDGAVPAPAPAAPAPRTADLIREQAAARPDAVALADETGTVSYRQLAALVAGEAVAWTADRRVAVPARHDREFVTRVLGLLDAGASPVLVEDTWPGPRRRRALLASSPTDVAEPGTFDLQDLPLVAPRPDLGGHCVLFTSGTTGAPLGVRTGQPVLEGCLADLGRQLRLGPGDRVSFLNGAAHDPVWRDVALPLRSGAALHIPPPTVRDDPARLTGWLREQEITVVNSSPILLALAFGLDAGPLPDLRTVVCGSAPLSRATAALIRSVAPAARIVNGYGCTETPQLVTALWLAAAEPLPPWPQLPVGQPLSGRRLEIRGPDGARCDVGQVGSVWVGEPHIADGYLGVAVPAERFQVDADGLRWFDTGDLARRDAAGLLHLAGRSDRQVLVNGHRVRLDEVEELTRAVPGVAEALAELVSSEAADSLRLWVQPASGATVAGQEVRAALAAQLLPAAVPSRIDVVDALAATANLKARAPEAPTSRDAAARAVDGRLRAVAEAVLGGPLDPTANFFDAGFTSVSLLQLTAELSRLLDREIPPVTPFQQPSLARLLRYLDAGPDDERPAALPARAGSAEPAPEQRARRRELRRSIRDALRPG